MTLGRGWPSASQQREVGVADEAGVDDRLDVAVGVEVQVGAVDREPDVGHAVVLGRDHQRVDRARRLVEVRPGQVDLGVLQRTSSSRRA